MEKLRREQKHGCPDLWTELRGEERLVADVSAFEHLKRKICWPNPLWENLASLIFNDRSVKKTKWLYTAWQ